MRPRSMLWLRFRSGTSGIDSRSSRPPCRSICRPPFLHYFFVTWHRRLLPFRMQYVVHVSIHFGDRAEVFSQRGSQISIRGCRGGRLPGGIYYSLPKDICGSEKMQRLRLLQTVHLGNVMSSRMGP
jgi:hypothetical protein